MNDFSNEMNEIYKLAGVQINEEQGYFTDWKSIRDKVIKMYIRGRLEETGYLEDDEELIRIWLDENASADMMEELYEITGSDGNDADYWTAVYINKNADEGGLISKIVYQFVGEYYDRITNDLQKEFEQNNLIYRMIDSDKSPKEIAQILKTNGTGNCWAKQEENAQSYYGNGHSNEYCLIGEATIDNVNWETTIYLRMMAEYENEVRLRKDSPIHIVGIKFYHYDKDNKLSKQDHMRVDLNLNVGHSYVFSESKQVNESIAYVSKKDLSDIILKNPTKRELRENKLTLCRCIEDSEGNWYFADMENMLHSYIVLELRDEASFPLFDGNDCYGIAYYDAESNEFWYNLNDYMYKKECIEQYNNSEYLRTTFPNARVIPNPWNNQMYDELYESVKLVNKEYFEDDEEQYINESILDAKSVDGNLTNIILKNPTRKELRDNGMNSCRGVMGKTGNFYFISMSDLVHSQLFDELKYNGVNEEPYICFRYLNKTNTFFFYNPDFMEDLDSLESAIKESPFFKNYEGCRFDSFDDQEYDPELDESVVYASKKDLSDTILKNPTRNELREYNNVKEWRIIQDTEGNYYFGDAMIYIHSDLENALLKNGIDSVSADVDNYGIVFYSMPANVFYYRLLNLVNDEDIEKEYLKSYLPKAFPNSKIERSNDDDEDLDEQLNEEIIHAEKSNYDDFMAVVLKNPTRKELRDNELEHSRFICYEDGTWLFFDSMQWIHEQILSKYRYGRCNGTGFYDLRSNEFIFMESMNYDEGEEGYEEEVAYYEDKCKKWLLTKPYIRENFGLNPRVTIYGDWVDSPW